MVFRFGPFELEPRARELRNETGVVHLEQQVFDVLCLLVAHRDRVVHKHELLDRVWGDRFVSDSALSSRIKSLRQALGDSGSEQHTIRTIHGVGYRFVADVTVFDPARHEDAPESAAGPGYEPVTVRLVEVRGGQTLAVAETGAGPPLVKAATFLTQVDKDTDQSPIWGHWVRALSRRHRYVRYDPRGCGLSERDLGGQDLTDLGLWVEDLHRVIDAMELDRVALLGISQGGPVATAFAAQFPERVSHLVLYGTYARGMRRRGDPAQTVEASLQVDLAKVGWGPDKDAFRAVFARQFVPDANADEIDWFNDQLRITTDSTSAPQLEAAFHDLDITDVARTVRVPTLVLHANGDQGVPFEEGRRLAGLIPGARFVALESRNHILLERDVAFSRFVDEVERFTMTD